MRRGHQIALAPVYAVSLDGDRKRVMARWLLGFMISFERDFANRGYFG